MRTTCWRPKIAQFEQQLKTLDAVPTIRQLRDEAEVVRAQTAEQARRMLAAGRDPRKSIDFLAATLTNRLLHGPSQRLREAAERGEVRSCWKRRAPCLLPIPDQALNERFDSQQTGEARRAARGSERACSPIPAVIADTNKFRELSMEYSAPRSRGRRATATTWHCSPSARHAQEMADGDDAEMRELGQRRTRRASTRASKREEEELAKLLLPKDARDDSNIYLEVRAGTGGDEAAIFAGDLFRMYSRYADEQGWSVEVLSESPGEHGGYKEVISRVVGRGAFSHFKFESGTHRVQRVPATEAQGRIHTSACHGRDPAGAGRDRADRAQSGGAAHRHLSRLRRRRPARQQDRLGDSHHAPADRHRGRMPG